MDTGYNTNTPAGPLSFVLGTGFVPQVLLSAAFALVLYIIMMSAEIIYKSFKAATGTRVPVLEATVSASDKPREYNQDPKARNSVFLPLSDNERSGAEFSYVFYLWVNPSSFKQEEGLLHVMHKGNPSPYPLMSPGVFLKSNTNTLRVYMNSSKTWNNYVDVENLPLKKWVHVGVIARDNSVEVYINGNLAKKLSMDGAVLYQNFGNLYLFSQRPCILNKTVIPSLDVDILQMFGTYTGNLSALTYYSYALSYTELQSIVAQGPSKETEVSGEEAPPYLEDAWWVNQASK
jgi:hypothetical protein